MPRLGTLAVFAWLAVLIVRVPEAPATVAEQRARLPPAVECENPVAGKWRALLYSFITGGRWTEWTLDINVDPSDETKLVGTIYVDSWRGDPSTPEQPMPCIDHFKGKMDATGSFVDGRVAVDGGPWQHTDQICGDPTLYNPDHFTGTIETERQEFQSVNNDGGAAVNQVTVFRRIGCQAEKPMTPRRDVKPPAFFPKSARRSGGC
jgi:hypothetical protein